MFVSIWRYQVRPERAAEFERVYGPEGAWAALFSEADGYIGTELLRETERAGAYLTIDRWRSHSAQRNFIEARADDYAELDERCRELTVAERQVGAFRVIASDEDAS